MARWRGAVKEHATTTGYVTFTFDTGMLIALERRKTRQPFQNAQPADRVIIGPPKPVSWPTTATAPGVACENCRSRVTTNPAVARK